MSLRPSSTRAEVRKKSYKTGVDADEARRRREDNLVEIRKNKREDNLLKKRREGLQGLPSQPMQQLLDASQNAAALEKRVLYFYFYFYSLLNKKKKILNLIFLNLNSESLRLWVF
jgi:hypothetical protein